ncbi:MAG: Bbp16 family capsid cement protein [Telluria sp.]
MILDNFGMVSGSVSAAGVLTGQAVTNTAVSTNSIDTNPDALGGNQPNEYGPGAATEVAFSVMQTATAAGAATVNFAWVQADDAALTQNVEIVVQTGPLPIAKLTAGTIVPLHLDRAAPLTPRRYVGAQYIVGTGPLTGGAFTAAIVKDLQDNKNIYGKSGFAVA